MAKETDTAEHLQSQLSGPVQPSGSHEAGTSQAPAAHAEQAAEIPPVHVMRQSRLLADFAVLATLGLYIWLPEKLTLGPSWLMPVVVVCLLVPLTVAPSRRHASLFAWQRMLAIILIGVINLANIVSLFMLVRFLLHSTKANGAELILEAIKIWMTNVLVFALWYWEFDRGGPRERYWPWHKRPDFLFPQMTLPEDLAPKNWTPSFLDYLFLSFTNATAFSPTDTLPLTGWAKMLMLAQSLTSLLTVALVASRAVNILGS